MNLACTRTALSPARQRALVGEWCLLLPLLPVTTVAFSSKVSQEMFEAACQVPRLQALSVKWSSVRSLEAVAEARALRALYLGSSPSVASLAPLSRLVVLEHFFGEIAAASADLAPFASLVSLREFGMAAGRGRRLTVRSLAPLTGLRDLEVLWLVSVQMLEDGLGPLHPLTKLSSLRTTIPAQSAELQALRSALPGLKCFRRVG